MTKVLKYNAKRAIVALQKNGFKRVKSSERGVLEFEKIIRPSHPAFRRLSARVFKGGYQGLLSGDLWINNKWRYYASVAMRG